jgi:DNA-directed RNA polymerase specialized sigma54-like protein
MMESARTVQHIVPDFLLIAEDDELKLTLNGRNAPELRISREYREMMQHYAKTKVKDAKEKEEKEMDDFIEKYSGIEELTNSITYM